MTIKWRDSEDIGTTYLKAMSIIKAIDDDKAVDLVNKVVHSVLRVNCVKPRKIL